MRRSSDRSKRSVVGVTDAAWKSSRQRRGRWSGKVGMPIRMRCDCAIRRNAGCNEEGTGQYLELAVLRIRTQQALAVHLVDIVLVMRSGIHLGLVVELGAVHDCFQVIRVIELCCWRDSKYR